MANYVTSDSRGCLSEVVYSSVGDHRRLDRISISELFHENTKMRRNGFGVPVPLSSPAPTPEQINYGILHAEKTYCSARKIRMPQVLILPAKELQQVIQNRRSCRDYTDDALPLDYLSSILALSCGVTGRTPLDDGESWRNRRATPSAGALYAIEVYCVVLNVDGLESGLYHYNAQEHLLNCLRQEDLRQELVDSVMYPEVVQKAAVIFLLAGIFGRNRFKYGERAYRFSLFECGHVSQNIYLLATALGVGTVSIGGFIDDELNSLLGMNGVDEAILYLMAAGKAAE